MAWAAAGAVGSVVGPLVVPIGEAIASIAPTHRQCSIKIINSTTSHILFNPSTYIQSGHCAIPLPHEIHPHKETIVEFAKTGHTARGAVGVFTYDVYNPRRKSSSKKLTFMFSVPYDFNLYSNWYAAGLSGMSKSCDYDLYCEMYYNTECRFVRRKGGSNITYTDADFRVMATMSDTYQPIMSVKIVDN